MFSMNRRRSALLALLVLVTVPLTSASAASNTHVHPKLRLQPTVVPAGGHLTFIGTGFRPDAKVWLGVGPPQSEARHWGSARTNQEGSFRKTLTVKPRIEPGRWVAIACQNGCRIKAGASFRVAPGRG